MHLGWRGTLLFWLATLSFVPVFVALVQGQTSILLLALFVGAFFALRGSHERTVGVCVAFALVKPPYVAPFLLVLLLQRRWRALGAFAITAVVLALVPLAVLGPSTAVDYLLTLVRASAWHTQFGYGPQWNHSLAGFDQLLLPATLTEKLTALLDLLTVAALAYATRSRSSVEPAYGLATVVALLVAPHVLIHDLCLVLLPVCITVRWRDEGSWRVAGLILAGYAFLLLGLRLVSVLHLQLSVIALLAVGCWLLLYARPALPSSKAAVPGTA
jgi:hypothetical protein